MDHPRNCLQKYRRAFAILSLLTSMIIICGCGKNSGVQQKNEDSTNLVSLVMAYQQISGRGQAPRSVDELMPVLKEIGDPQKLLRSPRDGQPYVIIWGIDFRKAMSGRSNSVGNLPFIAYEQQGKDGKRLAIDLGMRVKEYTAEEFARLKLPPHSVSRK